MRWRPERDASRAGVAQGRRVEGVAQGTCPRRAAHRERRAGEVSRLASDMSGRGGHNPAYLADVPRLRGERCAGDVRASGEQGLARAEDRAAQDDFSGWANKVTAEVFSSCARERCGASSR
jgi:hypothetical protein